MNSTVSRDGERWDQLAVRTLGRSDMDTVNSIIAANPQLLPSTRYATTLIAGLKINLPSIQQIPQQTVGTAPWRR
ncbi:hypothetical protein HG263_05385 [Pseudoalteromonas sp. JBTF-M23]|uniref:Phage tail protein X n=1 Tax=Pseudoalteromonas caenipelagi TaxID=2726988 RepID=A0A849VAT6_9GAMM|nr:tail protein X [Pseudoalteromonas caenipelagi]NOU49968.1 hypothetical protein [Pseudoalteromonas caenipelagi]